MFKKNPFGHYLILKKWLIRYLGFMTHRRYRGFNQLNIEGSEIFKNLPDNNVLFISNHQTYFADVVAMFHVFNASLSGRIDSIKNVGYLWNPKLNLYYVAAKETLKSGLLPRIMAYAGSVSIERTWRENGQSINRQVKPYAWVFYQKKDYKNALIWLEKSIKNGGSSSATIVEHYGDVLYQLGRNDEALEQWIKAKELGSDSEWIEKKIADKTLYE